MSTDPKVPIYEETYNDWTTDCSIYKSRRGYKLLHNKELILL